MPEQDENSLAAEVNKIIEEEQDIEFVADSMPQVTELIPHSFDFIGFSLKWIKEKVSFYQFATGREVKNLLEEHIPVWITTDKDGTKPLWTMENLCAARVNPDEYPAKRLKEGISIINASMYAIFPGGSQRPGQADVSSE